MRGIRIDTRLYIRVEPVLRVQAATPLAAGCSA